MFNLFGQINVLHYVYDLTVADTANNATIISTFNVKIAISLRVVSIINESWHPLQIFG